MPALPALGLKSMALDPAVEEADAVVLVTAHPNLHYAAIAARSALFVDLRGVTRGMPGDHLVRL